MSRDSLRLARADDRRAGVLVETDVPAAAVAEFRDGLPSRFKDYGDARLAVEAAGLPRP
jgi:hypothetical protein